MSSAYTKSSRSYMSESPFKESGGEPLKKIIPLEDFREVSLNPILKEMNLNPTTNANFKLIIFKFSLQCDTRA